MKRPSLDIKYFLIGILIGSIVMYFILFVSSLTIFEDGSFVGCLPYAICNLR